MSLKKNLSYNFILSFSRIIFPLISVPYVSRILSEEGFAKVNYIDAFTMFMVVLAEMGLPTYAIRELSRIKEDKKVFNIRKNQLISLHILITLILLVPFLFFIYLNYQKIQSPSLAFFSIIYFILNVFQGEWYFVANNRFKFIAIRSISTRILGLVIMFLFVKQEQDFFKYYWCIVLPFVLNILVNTISLFKGFKIDFKEAKQDIKKAFPIFIIVLCGATVIMLDSVILGITSSIFYVAYYHNAAKLVRVSGSLVTDSFQVLFPKSSAIVHNGNQIEINSLYSNSVDLIYFISLPLCFGIYFFADQFTEIYFGSKYLAIISNLKILAIYPFMKSINLFLSHQVMLPNKQDKKVSNGYVLGAFVFLVTSIFFSYYLHDIGTSWSVIISEIVMLIYFIWNTQTLINVELFYNRKKIIVISLVLLWFFISSRFYFIFQMSVFLNFTISVLIVMIGYVAIQFFFKDRVLSKIFLKLKQWKG